MIAIVCNAATLSPARSILSPRLNFPRSSGRTSLTSERRASSGISFRSCRSEGHSIQKKFTGQLKGTHAIKC